MTNFQITEAPLSQIPAIQLLIAMGYEYISLEQIVAGKLSQESVYGK